MLTSNMQKQENHKKYQKWTDDEKRLVVKLYNKHGKSFDLYKQHFPRRDVQQIKSFCYNQLYKIKELNRKHIQIAACPRSTSAPQVVLTQKLLTEIPNYIPELPDQTEVFPRLQTAEPVFTPERTPTAVHEHQDQTQEYQSCRMLTCRLFSLWRIQTKLN
ncbi:SANT/Myb_domain [Hexamita inflata]|uniref:SANT/Myb_domain n=1 Tax=Hexamita inflata TaxID=28002 RepID=A0ABP1KZI8_9EUKA